MENEKPQPYNNLTKGDRLNYDPTETHNRLVNKTIDRFKKQKKTMKEKDRKPENTEIPSYVKDTKDFIKKLNQIEEVPKENLLFTLHVIYLYTNIPNNEGIKAVKEAFDKYLNKTVLAKVTTTFLSLILTLNNFIFNSVNYIQKMGCAIGTVYAPSYANLFLIHFEEKDIYPYMKAMSLLYLRRDIDDIFIIWKRKKRTINNIY